MNVSAWYRMKRRGETGDGGERTCIIKPRSRQKIVSCMIWVHRLRSIFFSHQLSLSRVWEVFYILSSINSHFAFGRFRSLMAIVLYGLRGYLSTFSREKNISTLSLWCGGGEICITISISPIVAVTPGKLC